MSRNRKYTKFGLRSDKNLSDLSNSDQGIANVLNDISTNLNEFDQKSGFSLEDIAPLIGIRSTGSLASNVNEEGQSIDLANLADSKVQFIVSTGTLLTKPPGLKLDIEPMLTMQDYIDNSKSLLSDPPWLNGGDGPLCEFVSSDRIKTTITSAITGDSDTDAIGSLSNTEIFSTSLGNGYGNIVTSADFWDNGNFTFPEKLHPKLSNQFGLVQWKGYIVESPNQTWRSSGLFIIEQEILPSTTPKTYKKLKCVFADENTIQYLSWSAASENGTFIVSPFNAAAKEEMVKYVCIGMKVTQGTTLRGTVTGVDNDLGTCAVVAAAAGITAESGNAAGLKFSFDIGSDETISSGTIRTLPQRLGSKSLLRYTLWFPPLAAPEVYPNKIFHESPSSTFPNLPYSYFYSTDAIEENPPTYSHRYFHENKASVTSQRIEPGKKLKVKNAVRINYVPKHELKKVLATAAVPLDNAKPNEIQNLTTKQILIRDNSGRLYCKDKWEECSVGDWIAFKVNWSNVTDDAPLRDYHVSYQIQKISRQYAFVDASINQMPLMKVIGSAMPAPIIAVVFKNEGLVGIFSNNKTMSLTETIIDGNALLQGKRYRITTSSTGTPDFTNVGAANNNVNTIFIATGTNGGNGKVVLEADSSTTSSTKSYLEVSHSKADSLLVVGATNIVLGSSYKIITLTGTSAAQWHTAAGTQSTNASGANYHANYVVGDTFKAAAAGAGTALTVTAMATAGAFTCSPANIQAGDFVTVSGTFSSGSITGYASPKTYKITAVTGGSAGARTGFTLKTSSFTGDVALTTTAGTSAGVTYTKNGTVRSSIALPPIDLIKRGQSFFSVYLGPAGATVNAGSFVAGTDYKISSLGDTTQDEWNTAAGTTGVTYGAGHKFKAVGVGTTAGSTAGVVTVKPMLGLNRPEKLNGCYIGIEKSIVDATVGRQHRITNLGTSGTDSAGQADWNTAAGTTGVTYVVGDIIVVAARVASSTTTLTRKMTLVGEHFDARDITSQNYYENPPAVYDNAGRILLTAVYSSTGLEDQSESSRCAGVIGRQVISFSRTSVTAFAQTQVAAVIQLDSVEGIQLYDVIHHPLYNTNGGVSSGKVVQINVAASTIAIKPSYNSAYATTSPTLPVGATVAIVPAALDTALIAGGEGIGQLFDCVVPLDTAPPFEGTSDGLATPVNDNLEIYNSKLSFSELNLVVNPNRVLPEASAVETNSHFKIKHGSDTYKMLIKT